MPFDENLAARVREVLAARPDVGSDVEEKRMFGGLCFMVHGHMTCGLIGDELMVRLDPSREEEALNDPHARPMDFTGRRMRGFIVVEPAGIGSHAAIGRFVELGVSYVTGLPPKKVKPRKKTPAKRPASKRR